MPELMWVLLVLAVVVGVGGGWQLSRGRWGELPPVVDDRPPPRIPAGPFTAADVAAVRFARAGQGYDRASVEHVLQAVRRSLTRDDLVPDDLAQLCATRFRVVRGGYQMGQVDAVLDRLQRQFSPATAPDPTPVRPSADEPPAPADAQVRSNTE